MKNFYLCAACFLALSNPVLAEREKTLYEMTRGECWETKPDVQACIKEYQDNIKKAIEARKEKERRLQRQQEIWRTPVTEFLLSSLASESSKTVSTKLRSKHWLDGIYTYSNKRLKIVGRFINHDHLSGFHGCILTQVFSPQGELLAEASMRRGVNGTGFDGFKTKQYTAVIDLTEFTYKGDLTIRSTHTICGNDAGQVIKKLTRNVLIDPFVEGVRAQRDVTQFASTLRTKIDAHAVQISGDLIGSKAKKFFRNIIRVNANPLVDERNLPEILNSFISFEKSGNLDDLNPIYGLVATEVKKSRDENWDFSIPIPSSVIEKMPAEVKDALARSRYTTRAKVTEISLPGFALAYEANAIVLDDLIIFKSEPGETTDSELFLWAHESFHLLQVEEMGLSEFIKQFVRNEIAPRSPDQACGNAIEIAADQFALRHFPEGDAIYIKECESQNK